MNKFVGKYEQIEDESINKIISNFQNIKSLKQKEEIIVEFEKLATKESSYLTPIDIFEVVCQKDFKTDIRVLITLLLRNSDSLHQIK